MYLLKQLVAMYANTHFKGTFAADDFMPAAWEPKQAKVDEAEQVKAWNDTLRKMRENYAARHNN